MDLIELNLATIAHNSKIEGWSLEQEELAINRQIYNVLNMEIEQPDGPEGSEGSSVQTNLLRNVQLASHYLQARCAELNKKLSLKMTKAMNREMDMGGRPIIVIPKPIVTPPPPPPPPSQSPQYPELKFPLPVRPPTITANTTTPNMDTNPLSPALFNEKWVHTRDQKDQKVSLSGHVLQTYLPVVDPNAKSAISSQSDIDAKSHEIQSQQTSQTYPKPTVMYDLSSSKSRQSVPEKQRQLPSTSAAMTMVRQLGQINQHPPLVPQSQFQFPNPTKPTVHYHQGSIREKRIQRHIQSQPQAQTRAQMHVQQQKYPQQYYQQQTASASASQFQYPQYELYRQPQYQTPPPPQFVQYQHQHHPLPPTQSQTQSVSSVNALTGDATAEEILAFTASWKETRE